MGTFVLYVQWRLSLSLIVTDHKNLLTITLDYTRVRCSCARRKLSDFTECSAVPITASKSVMI